MKKINHKSDRLFAVLIIVVVALFVLVLGNAAYSFYGNVFYGSGGLFIPDFKSNKKDFEQLSEIAYQLWDEKEAENPNLTQITLNCSDDCLEMNLSYDDSSEFQKETVPMPDGYKTHYSAVVGAFCRTGIVSEYMIIHVYKSQIVYSSYGQHTVVYTRDGFSPRFMWSPDSEKEYKHKFCKRESLHLFQYAAKSDD